MSDSTFRFSDETLWGSNPQQVIYGAKARKMRTGQYLFTILPEHLQHSLLGTPFDPYNRDMNPEEITNWIETHVIFDPEQVVGPIGLKLGELVIYGEVGKENKYDFEDK